MQTESDSILLPVPSLASQDAIGCFALTVVFDDHGDGGPLVEWIPKEGDRILLSAGLGEAGIALGLNARTVLIAQSLALDGGMLRIGYAGRFERLIAVSLRPARELSVAALGSDFSPSLAGESDPLLTAEDVSGADIPPKPGDSVDDRVVHAELSAATKQLAATGSGGVLEFVLPLAERPQGSLLQTETGGLDPESWIEVSVNGESLGALGSAPFSLNSPNILFSASGRLRIAGWHPASLFLPARLWKEGDNSIILTLHRAPGDEGQAVSLRKTRADLLFTPTASASPSPTPLASPPPSGQTTNIPTPAPETLSTGSVYGNPSPSLFHASPPTPLN